MYFFNAFLFNLIILIFPLFLYLLYSIRKKNLNEDKSEILLDISIVSSFFLSIYFNKYVGNSDQIISLTIPLLFSFLYKRTYTSIFISVILIDFLFIVYSYNLIICIMFILSYFFLYFIYKFKTFSNSKFLTIFSSLTIIFHIFLNVAYYNINYSILSLTIIMYFLTSQIILKYINYESKILNIYFTMQDVEKEDHIQTSLFKITHEIKNPLAVVKGYISIFDVNNPIKRKKYIDIINNEIDRSLELLNDFKDLSKINVVKQEMDVMALSDDIKKTMIPLFNAKKIKYELKCESNIMINADYNRMKQVLVNLLKNSIEASNKEKSIITLTTFFSNDNLYIIVKDNGEGMDKDTLEKIFTPFYTTKHYGTGLGVCLSKEIIEAHNGSLNYTSVPNKGTIAKIVLPI